MSYKSRSPRYDSKNLRKACQYFCRSHNYMYAITETEKRGHNLPIPKPKMNWCGIRYALLAFHSYYLHAQVVVGNYPSWFFPKYLYLMTTRQHPSRSRIAIRVRRYTCISNGGKKQGERRYVGSCMQKIKSGYHAFLNT